MRSTFKILFYLKRNAPKKSGLVPVMCRITVNGKISQFSCKLDVEEKLSFTRPEKGEMRKLTRPAAILSVLSSQFSFLGSEADSDIDADQPLCIGMDYKANINWIVAGQPSDCCLNIVKSFYVKFERKIPALIDDFCRYYAAHRNKSVIYYYDATAFGSNYAVNEQDFRWVVVHEFDRHGWTVEAVYIGNPMRHDEKYLLFNQGFAGKQRLMPFFNRQNNDDLILAIQAAGVSRGRNGFRKDKGGEKLAESEEDLLQHRTDAFDTLYIGAENSPNPPLLHIR